jgi:UTP--glucose-1-phosphate uridylyltransferase
MRGLQNGGNRGAERGMPRGTERVRFAAVRAFQARRLLIGAKPFEAYPMKPRERLLLSVPTEGNRGQVNRSPLIRKAVMPVAGLGTRFLPATKAVPKEMLPIVDRPLVQYAVDEAVAAGIEEIIFVTSRTKRAIEDHFDSDRELQAKLQRAGNERALAALSTTMPRRVRFSYVRQPEPLGLGHAIYCARHVVGDEPFAVLLPDDLMDGQPPVLAQMVAQFERTRASLVAVQAVPREHTQRYGIVDAVSEGARLSRIRALVEKPAPAAAPSTTAIVGRYLLMPTIFDRLAAIAPGSGGEIQLTDALNRMLDREPLFAFHFAGRRFDCGTKIGFLEATVAFAMRHAELAEDFAAIMANAAGSLAGNQRPVLAAPVTASPALPASAANSNVRQLSLVQS